MVCRFSPHARNPWRGSDRGNGLRCRPGAPGARAAALVSSNGYWVVYKLVAGRETLSGGPWESPCGVLHWRRTSSAAGGRRLRFLGDGSMFICTARTADV
eukprot:TRINITY_DN11246_c0_g1_i3.p2 TRINITY_DN11246_c0_g1~~TRINITY_DN11246_c0_g1_i3.p2  ORF type:complete len:100 (-),score=4.15 TRINITY_DN11246_c0_g1_i3:24-323(-)